MAVILVIQWYRSANARRNQELDLCITANQSNQAIDEIVWIVPEEHRTQVPPLKGTMKFVPKRIHFGDAFDVGQDGDLVIIANTDMIITEEAIAQMDSHLKPGQVFALTRWNCDGSAPLDFQRAVFMNNSQSQDVWAWRAPMNLPQGSEIPLGYWGCDNRIAHEFSRSYKISNPSRTIRTYHVHASNFRTATPDMRIPRPYLLLPPTTL